MLECGLIVYHLNMLHLESIYTYVVYRFTYNGL